MWRLNACERLMLPPGLIFRRLAALRLVFIFGIALLHLGWRRVAPAERFETSAPLVLKPRSVANGLVANGLVPNGLVRGDGLRFLRFLLRCSCFLRFLLHFLL